MMSIAKYHSSEHDEVSYGFTLVWKIKNLSYCVILSGQNLKSPTFRLRRVNTKIFHWQLLLYPRGKNTTSVVCELSNFSSFKGKLKCCLCVYSTKGLQLYSERRELVYEGQSIESKDLASFGREIFKKLSDDAIILHCHMGILTSGKREDLVHYFAETNLRILRNIFYWKVENFKSLELEEVQSRDWLVHPALDWKSDTLLCMTMNSKLYVLGTDLKDAAVQIWLTFKDFKSETLCSCTLIMMDENKKALKYMKRVCWLGSVENILKFSFRREEATTWGLSTDALILRMEVNLSGDNGSMDRVVYGMTTNEAIGAAMGASFVRKNFPSSSVNRPSSLSADMLSLLKGDGPPSDFELQVAGRSFPVHQAVLGARSTVFRAMFSTDMLETSKRSLELTDVDADMVERMLLYVYGDQEPSPDLDWDSLSDLYSTADKYALLGLRKICADRLLRGLDVDKAPMVLQMADSHADPLLKRQVVEYFIVQGPIAIECENWKKLEMEDPKLANEVLHQILKEKWV